MTSHILKILLVLIALGSSYPIYIQRLDSLPGAASVFLYVFLFLFLTTLLCATAFIRNTYIRLGWSAVFLAAFVFYESCQRIFGEPLSYPTFLSMLTAGNFLNESVAQFSTAIGLSIVFGIVLFTGLSLPFKVPQPQIFKRAWSAPLIGCLLLTSIIFVRDGNGASGLPSAFTPIAYTGLLAQRTIERSTTIRKSVSIEHTPSEVTGDVVLIMDESVRGDYLDINSDTGVDTSLTKSREHLSIYNYGIAVSATNCSAGTNQIIRYGGTPEDFRYQIKTYPSIWQYAKSAGFKTVYIDSQRTNGVLHNNMKEDEVSDIDTFIQFDYTPVLQRDIKAAETIKLLAENNTREFIYVTKVGAHFPVNDKYPDSFMKYRPALARGRFSHVSDIGKRKSPFQSINWEEYKNSYRNTLLWNTGEFFRELLDSNAVKNSIVIYTADHGQNFHENKTTGINTHCSENPSMEEGVVPLVVITGKEAFTSKFLESASYHHNKASHFAIFPTLLSLFGYEKNSVYDDYGPSLFDKQTYPFAYNYTFFENHSFKDKWMFVDPYNIAQ